MLVGGLMVHAHAHRAGIQHARPTDDADLVVELGAGSYAEAAAVLRRLGYVPHESLDS
jgi:fructose-specific component phosphotransferase system IIB-like protein